MMNPPNQSPPVMRTLTTAIVTNGLTQSRCTTLKKIACAGALAACAAVCIGSAGTACVQCLAGIGASRCLDCVR
jgi:hypothetical protein